MRIYRYRRTDSLRQNSKSEIDLGFDRKDSLLLSNESIYSSNVQIFTKSKPEYLNKLDEKQFCSTCRTELLLLEKTQKLLCKSCGNAIPVMANSPLVQTTQGLRPFGSQVPSEYDKPFMIGLVSDDDCDKDDDDNNEITYSSSDRRIMRIKLAKGIQNISEKEISRL